MKYYKKYLKIILTVIIFSGLYYYWNNFYDQYAQKIGNIDWSIDIPEFFVAFFLYFLGYVLRAILWSPVRYEFTDNKMSLLEAFSISAKSWMGRYIPGKIWAFISKTTMSSNSRKELGVNFIATIADMVILLISGSVLGLISFLFIDSTIISIEYKIIIILMIFSGIIITLIPSLYYKIINHILKFLHQDLLKRKPNQIQLFYFFISNITTLIFWGASFYVVLNTTASISFKSLPFLISLYSLARVLGVLIMVSPAGLGIREGILLLGVSQVMGLNMPVIFYTIIIARLISILVEVTGFLISIFFLRFNRFTQINKLITK